MPRAPYQPTVHTLSMVNAIFSWAGGLGSGLETTGAGNSGLGLKDKETATHAYVISEP